MCEPRRQEGAQVQTGALPQLAYPDHGPGSVGIELHGLELRTNGWPSFLQGLKVAFRTLALSRPEQHVAILRRIALLTARLDMEERRTIRTAMTTMRIPRSAMPGLQLIAELPDDQFTLLLEHIRQIEVGEMPSHYARKLVDGITYGDADADDLAHSLYGLGSLLNSIKPDILGKDVTSNFSSLLPPARRNDLVPKFGERLPLVLANLSVALAITAKAVALSEDAAITMRTVKILTDVRSIDSDQIDVRDRSIIMHTLCIDYVDDTRERRRLYVGMDEFDLIDLKKAVEKAEKKHADLLAASEGSAIVWKQ